MPHIDLPAGLPGILGPLAFRPETAAPLNALTEALLRGPGPLGRGERELIAAYVSKLNGCNFCHASHATFAALQLGEGFDLVDAVMADPSTPRLDAKMRALLRIAARVAEGGRSVADADVSAAREAGASDVEIHDTVLIAAAFCMFNRYVDGLATFAPPERKDYEAMGRQIVERGYLAPPP